MIKYGNLTLDDRDREGMLWVTACEKDATEVKIPLCIDGQHVVGIGAYAFENCRLLERVLFDEADEDAYVEGELLSVIEEHAFMGCSSLTEIELPSSVFSVGHGAFHSCTALREVKMPSDPYLAPYVFYGCVSLSSVTPTSYPSEGVFSGCSSLAALPLTDGVEEICEDAFEGCEGLTAAVIGKGVKCIEALAFRGSSLTSVTFEEPEGWVEFNSYRGEDIPLDLSNPVANAELLSRMDFDDGVVHWKKK